MLHYIIQQKKNEWLQSDDCTIRDLVKYIRDEGHLRDTQREYFNKCVTGLFQEIFSAKSLQMKQAFSAEKIYSHV